MDNLNVSEGVTITEHIEIELETDAVIYRNEFERHHAEYLNTKTKDELILSFVFLQIYVECFLHQNMRRVIEREFKHTGKIILDDWFCSEAQLKYVPQKLDKFVKVFFPKPKETDRLLINAIKSKFHDINEIRNFLIHGYKIASWSDSGGNSGQSNINFFLSEVQLSKSINEMNELGNAWNNLLDNIFPECKCSTSFDDFKFEKFT